LRDKPYDPTWDASLRASLLGQVERIACLGGFVWTRGDELVHWSEELFRMLGYDSRSVAPTEAAFLAAVHPEDRERVRRAWAGIREGVLDRAEYRIVNQNTEEVRYVRASGQSHVHAGRVQQIVGAVQDITELRRSELALEEARAISSAAERVAGIGSFVLRVDELASLIADGLEPVTSVGEGPPRTTPSCAGQAPAPRVHPEDREKRALWWEGLAREHVAEPLSLRVLRADGSVRHLQTHAVLVRLADGV
jgi:PAS domain S-box-containing protein